MSDNKVHKQTETESARYTRWAKIDHHLLYGTGETEDEMPR